MNVEVNGNTKNHCAKTLEIINSKLFDSVNKLEEQYIIILTYDAVSEYYCNKIFFQGFHASKDCLEGFFFLIYIF
ncbi:hypothetical protein [Lacrimispora xylanisolvens]|uniref:hypothetical protein n=1 Tax=Lacrimispora xylanisolvens TaxID=384636 RepID=UPI0024026B60